MISSPPIAPWFRLLLAIPEEVGINEHDFQGITYCATTWLAPFQEKSKRRDDLGGKLPFFFWIRYILLNPLKIYHFLISFLFAQSFISSELSKVHRSNSQDCFPCKSFSTLVNFSKSPQILDFDSMARGQARVRASKLARLVNSEDSMAQFGQIYRVPFPSP